MSICKRCDKNPIKIGHQMCGKCWFGSKPYGRGIFTFRERLQENTELQTERGATAPPAQSEQTDDAEEQVFTPVLLTQYSRSQHKYVNGKRCSNCHRTDVLSKQQKMNMIGRETPWLEQRTFFGQHGGEAAKYSCKTCGYEVLAEKEFDTFFESKREHEKYYKENI